MHNISTLLYQVWQIRKLEELAIQKFDVNVDALMERAGKAAFHELRKHWPRIKNIIVVCGKGNNAGDGYVVARLARAAKFKVKVLQLVPDEELQGAALHTAERCRKAHVKMEPFTADGLKGSSGIIVDAILGTGLVDDVSSEVRAAITAINASGRMVLALDVPSGISADTGSVLGSAVKADVTVTFLGFKLGLFVGEARDYCGKIIGNDLQLPSQLFTLLPAVGQKLNLENEFRSLRPRRRNCHKGDFGHVLVVGGDYGMGGAVRIAAEAALRVGAGLVTVATRAENVPLVIGTCPEIMSSGIRHADQLLPILQKASVIILGPGLGTTEWSKELFACAIKTEKPLIVDADALKILAANYQKRTNWILTPHPGEAARLLKSTSSKIQSDRLGAIQKMVTAYGGVIVLKGSGTLIATAGGQVSVCDAGNPGMASAGMGDLLSGIIAGLLAQGLDAYAAARLGVLVHATAGDNVAYQTGDIGILALDLLPEVRKILNER